MSSQRDRPDPMMLPAQMDAWKHSVITPSTIQGIRYPDGRKGLICQLADGSVLTLVLSERAAATVASGLVGTTDGTIHPSRVRIPGMQ